MYPSFRRALTGIAVLGALIAALGLAGCGRKGGLDPPPAAAIEQPGSAQSEAHDEQGRPVAPPPRGKQPFILDWLLN